MTSDADVVQLRLALPNLSRRVFFGLDGADGLNPSPHLSHGRC
jgi:hypothetical protein